MSEEEDSKHEDSQSFVLLQDQLRAAEREREEQARRIQDLDSSNEQLSRALKGAHIRLAEKETARGSTSFTVDEDLSPIKIQESRMQMMGTP